MHFELLEPRLAKCWQESCSRRSKVFAMPLPLPTAGLLQATKQPQALSSLPSTSLQIPAEASRWAPSCRDSLAQVLNLIQVSCNVRTVNSQMEPNHTPGCAYSLLRTFQLNLSHLKINDGSWKNSLWEPLCKSSSNIFYFPLCGPTALISW